MKPGDLVRSVAWGWLRSDPIRGGEVEKYPPESLFLVLPPSSSTGVEWFERVLSPSGSIGFIHKEAIEVIRETR